MREFEYMYEFKAIDLLEDETPKNEEEQQDAAESLVAESGQI